MSNKRLEQNTNGEDQNSQIQDEMREETNEPSPTEFEAMNIQKSISYLRKEKGDLWTASYIAKQFPSIRSLLDIQQ